MRKLLIRNNRIDLSKDSHYSGCMRSVNTYDCIERAIVFICDHYQQQPGLEVVAKHVGMSKFHFQRVFRQWAGVSPKNFMQYLTAQHAKQLLRKGESTLNAAYGVGLSGTGRLHDLFVKVESMSPGEFKNLGKDIIVTYTIAESCFGKVLIAETDKGVCHVSFFSYQKQALAILRKQWPHSVTRAGTGKYAGQILMFLQDNTKHISKIPLLLKGTPFQIKVWEALLKIPAGRLVSYQMLSKYIAHPRAVRAVGTAVGQNPIAYIIPCHRVIRGTGVIGQYRWGAARKTAMIGRESGFK